MSTTPVGTPQGSESRLPDVRPALDAPDDPTSSGPRRSRRAGAPAPLPRTLATVPTGGRADLGQRPLPAGELAAGGSRRHLRPDDGPPEHRLGAEVAVERGRRPAERPGGRHLLVTRWPTGTAQAAFDGLGSDGAACRFGWAVTPFPVSVQGRGPVRGPRRPTSRATYQGGTVLQVSAAARVGDLAVGVSVESSRPAARRNSPPSCRPRWRTCGRTRGPAGERARGRHPSGTGLAQRRSALVVGGVHGLRTSSTLVWSVSGPAHPSDGVGHTALLLQVM